MPAGVCRVVRKRIPGSNCNGGDPLYSTVKWVLSQRPLNWRIFLHVPALSTESGTVLKSDFLRATRIFPTLIVCGMPRRFFRALLARFFMPKMADYSPSKSFSGYCANRIIPVHQVNKSFQHIYPSISVWENRISSIFASICKAAASFSQGKCFSSKIARKGRIYCSPA